MGRTELLAWADAQIDRAIALQEADRDEQAHALLVNIAGHFAADDPSRPAGRLWHTLGVAWRSRKAGTRADNLLWSQMLLERARTHRHRRQDMFGWRLAVTRDQLAVTLRQLAHLAEDETRAAKLRRRAEKLFRASIEWYRRIRYELPQNGWQTELMWDLFGVQLNLANLLLDQERLDDAARLQEQTIRAIQAARDKPPTAPALLARIKLNLAGVYTRRGGSRDLQRAAHLLDYARQHGTQEIASCATLEWADCAARSGHEEDAIRALSAIRPGHLPRSAEPRVIDRLVELGADEHALSSGSQFIDAAFRRRLTMLGPADADTEALHAQRIAALLARVHVDREEHAHAFLVLENSTGTRFFETVRQHLLVASNRIDAELWHLCAMADTCGIWCHQSAGHLQVLGPGEDDARRAFLDELHTRLGSPAPWPDPGPWGERILEQVRAALLVARDAADPAAALLAAGRALTDEGRRYQDLLERRDPYISSAYGLGNLALPQLETIARERAGEVYIRLSLLRDLLAVSCWHRDGRLHWASARIELNDDHHRVMRALVDNPASAADGRAAAIFAALDLSPAFPPHRGGNVVFLPSRLAATLPLAALGPPDRTPLDHFEGVRVMVGLDLLRLPAAPHIPRLGQVSFVGPDTSQGSHAFENPLPNERRIEADEATVSAVQRAVEEADVVAIYAHGHHDTDELVSGVALVDGVYPPAFERMPDHAGLERIELWACRSGDNRDLDPRGSPFVDELPGLDASLLGAGVRSVLSATLPVREGIAAEIAGTYRRSIAQGSTADVALADAMRWWRDVRLPTIEATKEIGPLSCPSTWAVFRVLGVCERRPTEPLSYDPQRPLTDDEHAEIERLLSDMDVSDAGPGDPRAVCRYVTEQIEIDIAATLDDIERAPGDIGDVLVLAELYRNRLVADHRHNLIRALAWIHDALAGARDPEHTRLLRIRAAHLWLDLAMDQAGFAAMIGRTQAWSAIQPRLTALLEALAPHDAWGARAMLATADVGFDDPDEAERVRQAFVGHPPFATLDTEDLTAACEVAARAPEALPAVIDSLRAAIVDRLRHVDGTIEHIRTHQRLGAALQRLLRAAEMPVIGRVFIDGLTPRERWLATSASAREAIEAFGGDASPDTTRMRDYFLQDRDEAVWGEQHPPDPTRWRGTGGHGQWYRMVVAGLAGVAAHRVSDHRQTALHLLACIHLAGDLRTQQHHRWSSFLAGMPREVAHDLWSRLPVMLREEGLDALVDAALAPTARLDPFVCDIGEIRETAEVPQDMPAWAVMAAAADPFDAPLPGHTAAGRLVRALTLFDHEIEGYWSQLHEQAIESPVGPDFIEMASEMSSPPLHIETMHARLREADRTVAHLAVGRTPEGVHYALVAHRDVYRFAHSDSRWGVPELMALFTTDWESRAIVEARGLDVGLAGMPRFRDAWSRVAESIGQLAGPLLAEALDAGAKTIHVLAPGALRPIPWGGIPVAGRTLSDRLAARGGRVTLIPALEWWGAAPPAEAIDAALVGDTGDLAPIVDALHTTTGVRRLVIRDDIARRLTELNRLTRDRTPVGRLQIIGAGDAGWGIPSMASISLGGGPVISPRAIAHLRFMPGAEVEIWADPDRRSIDEHHLGSRDRLPGFVRSALRAGARGVLDLAWPIDPLLRALLIEDFTLATRVDGHDGGRAATGAVSRVRAMVRRALDGGLDPLAHLDAARALRWMQAGLPGEARPALSDLGLAIDPERLDAVLDAHLAAVRWWGA